MTGGQYSPTTPYGSKSTTSIYGHVEHAFSIAELAVTAGASFVARGTVYHAAHLDKFWKRPLPSADFRWLRLSRTAMFSMAVAINWVMPSR